MFNARVLPRPEGSLWRCSVCIMQRKSENVVIYFSFVGDKRQRSTRQVTRHVSQKEKNAPSVLSLETLPAEWETTRQRTTFGPLRMNPKEKVCAICLTCFLYRHRCQSSGTEPFVLPQPADASFHRLHTTQKHLTRPCQINKDSAHKVSLIDALCARIRGEILEPLFLFQKPAKKSHGARGNAEV